MSAPAGPAAVPPVAALVLAAGRSSRMAPHNKLLLRDQDGVSMVARVAAACAASRVACVLVVTGHQAAAVTRAVRSGLGAAAQGRTSFVHAPDHAAGLSASLRAGVQALPPWMDGVLVCLGDMPLVDSSTIDRIVAAFGSGGGWDAVVPMVRGRRGNPVLWAQAMFPDLCALSGDAGAGRLLALRPERVAAVECGGPAVLTDYDSPAMLPGCWQDTAGPLLS